MKLRSRLFVGVFITTAVGVPVLACLWDYDTLVMERARFPGTLELITGRFPRHSQAFYEWRIKDRLKTLSEDRENLAAYDDLAVAYDKTGRHDKAIETILAKDTIRPGLYETEANLGTFYIHNGRLEKGLEHIERAIEINPDAHFGRGIYQKHLVNYVLLKRRDGSTRLPLDDGSRTNDFSGSIVHGFAEYVLEAANIGHDPAQRKSELDRALKGVQGMMHFGDHKSPILLEALGDLLLGRVFTDDAKRLAARAYLKASYEAETAEAKDGYYKLARQSLSMQTKHEGTENQLSIYSLEDAFVKELAEADRWFETVKADEQKWIAEGENVDEAFADKYYKDVVLSSIQGNPYASSRGAWARIDWRWIGFLGALVVMSVALSRLRSKRSKAA